MDWETIFANLSDKGLASRRKKELSKFHNKNPQKIQVVNGQKTQGDISPKTMPRWQMGP